MKARPILRVWKVGRRWRFDYYSPETVLPFIRSRVALIHCLEFYSCPFIGLRVADSTAARRHHVQKVRPALRWFCKQLRVTVPRWLRSDGRYLSCSRKEHLALFGPAPLAIREFTPERRRNA